MAVMASSVGSVSFFGWFAMSAVASLVTFGARGRDISLMNCRFRPDHA
jgi:hypothetical protein